MSLTGGVDGERAAAFDGFLWRIEVDSMIRPTTLTGAWEDSGGVVLEADAGHFRLTPYGPNIVHVAYFPGAEATALPMWGFGSRPVDGPRFERASSESGWSLSLEGIRVEVESCSASMRFARVDGTALTAIEYVGLTPVVVSGERTYQVHAVFEASAEEGYYGLGQHQQGWMDHRAQEVPLWHDYKAHGGEVIGVPMLVGSAGRGRAYGVAWDNPSRTMCMPGRGRQTLWQSEVGEAMSMFIIAGADADEVYAGYRSLTGPTPMPPMAALGYIQCKQRYASRDELMRVARTYREKGYPCDILVVDWFHWETLGDLDLDARHWPDPAGMNDELGAMGYQVMISCWPRFMKSSKHYGELERRGWFMADADGRTIDGTPDDQRGALIDTTNPEAARWYWRTIHESYGERGFSSWWLDEDEPDVCPHAYYFDAGSGARLHNLYPFVHTRAVYEGHRRDRADRCLTLTRSAYHGAQRFGTTFWSSDIHPRWDVFKRQIPCGLNFCATGLAYWSSDIGGWHGVVREEGAGDADEGAGYKSLLIETGEFRYDPDAAKNYAELYVRWFQYGAFCPTFRAHGTRPENEVWSYGPEAEAILVEYLELRYRLLPYIYSQAWRTTRTGAPFMRALFMDFPDDPNVRDLKDQYMFGPAFLVAPVHDPGATRRRLYLPAGADWYDYWTGERYEGGRPIEVDAPLSTLPLFVRAGSIVPHGEVVDHTGVPQTDLELRVYEGADGRFDLYRDDGVSYGYEHGDYALTPILWDERSKRLTIEDDPEGLFDRPEGEYLRRVGG